MILLANILKAGSRRLVCIFLIISCLGAFAVRGLAVSPVSPATVSSNPPGSCEACGCNDPQIAEPFHIDFFGRASYLAILAPYYVLLAALVWHFRVILQFMNWRFYILASGMVMLLLGLALEWLADLLYVWSFPVGRDFGYIKIPIFGWLTGHRIPICELFWIVGVVPLFYYLWFWATLVFNDVIYVVDENGNFYKKEERWVGFHKPTRILTRPKYQRGQENERVLKLRQPGFVSKTIRKIKHAKTT
jgi:hypothetical protein